MKKWLVISLFVPLEILSQTPNKGELEMEIESITEGRVENETDLIQLAENLHQLRSQPIEINFADADHFQQLPFLNIFQINNLIQYRSRTGLIYSPYELAVIKGFDRKTIEQLLPYLNFTVQPQFPNLKPRNIWRYSRNNIILRASQILESRQGFIDTIDNGFLGPPQNLYLRYKWSYRNYLSIGFVAQQDAGEPWSNPHQKTGVDFLAGHIAITQYGNLKSLIIGDYQAQFGQGLALWSNIAFGKSADVISIKRYAQGFKPFTGAEENRFFRGTAITYRFFDALDISAFYSSNAIDANRTLSDTSGTEFLVSSLQSTGLHRTINELEDKDANTLQSMGANANFKGKNWSLGTTLVHYNLAIPLESASQLYQIFRFSDQELTNLSLDANYLYRSFNLFGELASDHEQKLALMLGLQSNPYDGFYLSLAYRHFDKAYQSLLNAPFAERGNYGEKGTYLGTQWQLNSSFLLKTYIDFYEFRWLSFEADAPSRGRDILSQLDIYINRSFSAYLRFKKEIQQVNTKNEGAIQSLVERTQSSLRIHLAYSIKTNIKMASRVQYAFYNQEEQRNRGYIIFQDFSYKFQRLPLKLTTRFALIDTDSYSTRIYAYENDVSYTFSIPPYYGRSTRFYLLLDYSINEFLGFQIRYSISSFQDRDILSSGLQEIDGSQISELKMQLRFKF